MAVRDGLTTARPIADRAFFTALVRALAGAVLLGLPLLMTQEMWTLSFTMKPERLALLLVLTLPLLTGLAYYGGFRHNLGFVDSLVDALVAFALGTLASALVLLAFGIIDGESSLRQIVGVVALEAVPMSMGAALARSQLGQEQDGEDDDNDRWEQGYGGELFLMLAGALFFAFNVAPTEEVVRIVLQQGHPAYALGLALVSVLLLHGFVYTLDFKGQHAPPAERVRPPTFFAFTLPGYALVLLVSLLVLWIFGRTDGQSLATTLHMAVVLGLPGAVGAATARLVL